VADEEVGERAAPCVPSVAEEEIMSEPMPAGFMEWWYEKGRKLHEQLADDLPAKTAAKYTAWDAWLAAQQYTLEAQEQLP
jgi:hypothetical protein